MPRNRTNTRRLPAKQRMMEVRMLKDGVLNREYRVFEDELVLVEAGTGRRIQDDAASPSSQYVP